MASIKTTAEFILKTDSIKQGSKQAVQSFDKMASSAKSAMGKIDGRADKTASNLKRVGNAGKQAGQEVRAGAKKGETGLNDLSNTAKKAERDIGGVAISVLGLGSSVTGLSDTIFGMKEKMVALERSTFGLEQTTEDVKRMQEDFDKAVAEGTMTVEEQARAVKDLELAYKDLAIEEKEVQAETEAMNSEWVSFAVNTATTAVFAVTTIKTAFDAETLAKLRSVKGTMLATLANKGFVKSLWAIAKHPVFLIATAGLAIWESNLFGLRSEIENWAGIDDLSLLGNLEKTFSSNIPEASAETYDAMDSIEKKAEELQESFDETTTQSNKGIIPMINDVGDCSVKSARKVDSLTDSIENLKKKQRMFRLDYVNEEKKFQEQVARINGVSPSRAEWYLNNSGISKRAQESGLGSFTNYLNMMGINIRESGMFGHSLTTRFTDPMKHWRGIVQKYPSGGKANDAIASQQSYNASISGFDNNSTSGWSGKALKTKSLFQQRIQAKNAKLLGEYNERKARAKRNRAKAFAYFDYWGVGDQFAGVKNWKPIWRSLGYHVGKHRRRRAFLQKAGYDTSTPEALAEAEEKYAIDKRAWITQTGLESDGITKLIEADRRTDIFNIIEHRRRLGLISSGVI